MTAWLLSVAGTGILGVLIGHLTSKTRMHSVIKTACTYVFLLVLIFPIPTFFAKGIDMTSCSIFNTDFSYNENVLDKTGSAYFAVVEAELNRKVKEIGYYARCSVKGRIDGEKIIAEGAEVTVFGEFADSSSVILEVRAFVAEYLGIDQGAVRVSIGQD